MSNRNWDIVGAIAGAIAGFAALLLWYRQPGEQRALPEPELDHAVQCTGHTRDGERCKRVTTHASHLCYLHR